MLPRVYVFDPTVTDRQSAVRGVGRYLQLLKENFPQWIFINDLSRIEDRGSSIFIYPFFNLLQPPLLMKRIAKKQITVIHDLIPLKFPEHFPAGIRGNINIRLNKLALNNYDLIVTDSEASKKDIIKILGIEDTKIKVIYPCLPRIFTNPKSDPSLEVRRTKWEIQNPRQFSKLKTKNLKLNENWKLKIENFCLYVGDATWNKNLVNLAKAIKIINIPCIFVGKVFDHEHQSWQRKKNIWQEEFYQFLKETKNDRRFIFSNFVEDYKLFKLYQQARVNILISRDEGFGFSYLEAANFSTPSVLSDIPVLREISVGKGAVFANPKSPNDIADRIGQVYFNSDLRTKLGLEAQYRAKSFNPINFIKNFLTLF